MKYRRATFRDVESIHKIVNQYAEQGLMLARSRNSIYENLRDFILAEENEVVVGVGALHLVWDELAEIRAMAIAPEYTGKGIGMSIVEQLANDGRALGVKTLFTLTYQPGFFAKADFHEVPKERLSQKVWKDCINCSKFPNCDEIAMIRKLD
ncbi:MAG TPA: N-acetyltransferase [Negativicutes bacterium]|nr:N-acetyltransferase [Negativicutes bacterium]